MAVTLELVRDALGATEPEYDRLARELGVDAVPHLTELVLSGDMRIATKATYLAALIDDPRCVAIVESAAKQPLERLRVAAGAAAMDLGARAAASILARLVKDPDAGVQRVALRSIETSPSMKLMISLIKAKE